MSRVAARSARPVANLGRGDTAPPGQVAPPPSRRTRAERPAPTEPAALPAAGELFVLWHESWRGAQLLEAVGSFGPTRDPLVRSLHGERPLANAADYRTSVAAREQRVSYAWGQAFCRNLSAAGWRLLTDSERTWQRAYQRGRHDAGGSLSQAPRGPLLNFARWQRRTEDAEALAAGRFDPEASLIPPGAPPPLFTDPLAAASAVFQAGATVQALEAHCLRHRHLKASPFPKSLLTRIRVANEKARADLKLVQTILRSLHHRREWEPLLALEPETAQADARTVARLWAEASMSARQAALGSCGFWEFGRNTPPLTESSLGVDGRSCWWAAGIS